MSTIDNRKKTMGWAAPNVRPACGNCSHVETEPCADPRKALFRCSKGGFWTPRYAICKHHEPLCLTGGAGG